LVLRRSLPRLIAGTAVLKPQDLALGSYYGGRRPEDGRIDWRKPAREVHNLVRAVAPPYPGAFTELGGKTLRILRTRLEPVRGICGSPPGFYAGRAGVDAVCADGGTLALLEMECQGKPFAPADFLTCFGDRPIPLPLP
jgi:methionyl-tRNA formyltransferase